MSGVFGHRSVRRLVELALDEDVGRGDVTTAVTVEPGMRAEGRVVTRQDVVVAGLPIARVVFDSLAAAAEIDALAAEGARAAAGTTLAVVRAEAAAILTAERVLLNFLQRTCGVATWTRRFVDEAAGTRATIVDTRKTIPGWRLLDKYAVRAGGGRNHRLGLDDGILVKDNHVAACGGIEEAVRRARARAPHLLRVEVECDTLAEVDEAVAAGADLVLLDNMTTSDLSEAVRRVAGRALTEASGGIGFDRVREVAATGVDLVSIGALTHSAPAADLSLELVT